MKNEQNWVPGKFVFDRKGRLRASKDRSEMKVSSRLMADLIAKMYQEHIGTYVKGRLADLGCGKVPLYAAYRDHITESTCADWSFSVHKNEFLDVEVDLTKLLPFEDNRFDTVILSDVLEHIPEPQQLWNEIYRILDKKGIMLMNVPFFYPLHERPYDFYRYSEFALKRQAELAGFEVLVLKPIGGSLEVLADFFGKHIRYIPLIGNPIAGLIQSLVFWFGNTNTGQKAKVKSAAGYPFGYFMVVKKN